MINIPLSFGAMWFIMFCGILTNALAKINNINKVTPEEISFWQVIRKFARKEWPSYGMSLIATGIVSFSFVFMKQFQKIDNEEISRWAKWIPLAVLILYLFGIVVMYVLYKILGRIQDKTGVDITLLKDKQE